MIRHMSDQASNVILLCCYQMLEDIVLVATGTLEVVIMKGMSVYHHLHLRSKLLSCCRGPSLPVPTKVLYSLLQEEQLRKCFDWY